MAANSASSNCDRIILKSKSKNKDDECAICIDSLYQKKVAYLPCSHFFHHDCLTQAFEKQLYSCPLCRYDLVPALQKINFKFVNWNVDRDAYIRNSYFRNAYYTIYYNYNIYNDTFYNDTFYNDTNYDDTNYDDTNYDDMPDLIDDSADELAHESANDSTHESENDNLSSWTGLLVHLMQDTLSTSLHATSSPHATSTSPQPINIGEMEPEVVFRDILIFYNV